MIIVVVVIGALVILVLAYPYLSTYSPVQKVTSTSPAQKFLVYVKESLNYGWGYGNNTNEMYYYARGLLVTFNQDNKTAAKCFLGTAGESYYRVEPTGNVTLQEGQYVVNVYDSGSGVYVQTMDFYVASTGITLNLGPYQPPPNQVIG